MLGALLILAANAAACSGTNDKDPLAWYRADQLPKAEGDELMRNLQRTRTVANGHLPPDYKSRVDDWFARNLPNPASREVSFQSNPLPGLVCGEVSWNDNSGHSRGREPFVAIFDDHLVSVDIEDSDTMVNIRSAYDGDFYPYWSEQYFLKQCKVL